MIFKDIFNDDNIDVDYSEQMINIMVIHNNLDIRMRLSLDTIKQFEEGGEVIGEPYMCDPCKNYVYQLSKKDVAKILATCKENEGSVNQ